jgi:hypothetical protein
VDVEPDMVAGGQRPGRVVEARRTGVGCAGLELRPEGRHFHAQAIRPAHVIAQHVERRAATPELLAMLELVDQGGAVARVVGADDDEDAHAQADEPAGHPVQHEDRHRDHAPEALECDFHGSVSKQFACRKCPDKASD